MGFCAAPESLVGRFYHETSVADVRSNIAFARFFRSDGTYRSIFFALTYGSTTAQEPPPDGTWSYRKTGETTGELIFNGSEVRRLAFSTDGRGGSVAVSPRFGTFWLVNPSDPLSRRASLSNCSNRALMAPQGRATAGFVLTETTPVLVRAAGPALSQFGVQSSLSAPVLEIFAGQSVIARNAGWTMSGISETLRRITEYVGAFPFAQSSSDSAVFVVLSPGAYTAQATSVTGAAGEVLIEVYVAR
jgi:hypothetical protein